MKLKFILCHVGVLLFHQNVDHVAIHLRETHTRDFKPFLFVRIVRGAKAVHQDIERDIADIL